MPAAVVAHCGADRLGHFPELGKDILQRHGSDGRMILDRIVEVGHVGRVMKRFKFERASSSVRMGVERERDRSNRRVAG